MTISVIIPSYKPDTYIFKCLQSLVDQTLSKESYEVIIVLNGCKSPYYENLLTFIGENSGVSWILLQTDRGGVSNARNLGMRTAKGEYIAFIDDDDYVSNSYLQELLQKSSPDTVSLCYPLAFDDGEGVPYKYLITDSYEKLCDKQNISLFDARSFFSGPVYKLIHKDIIGDVLYDEKLANGEDTLFMFAISDKIKKISIASKKAVYYRRFRNNSASLKVRGRIDVIYSNMYQIKEYIKILFSKPTDYSFPFAVTRIGGSLYAILKGITSFKMIF